MREVTKAGRQMEISVIIPCYNAEQTIWRALESLEGQTYKNFEVVIIDDGSKDNTNIIIKNFIENYELDIKLFCQKNSGVSAARNRGLKEAQGRYIAFLDADDFWHPEFLEILHNGIETSGTDLAVCRYSHKQQKENLGKHTPVLLDRIKILDKYVHKRITKINFVTVLYKKSILKEYEIFFRVGIKYGEDTEFFGKYLFHCKNGGIYIDRQLYYYILRPGSAIHAVDYKKVENIRMYRNVIDYWNSERLISQELEDYIIARAIWAAAKDFAGTNMKFYEKFCNEYDVKWAMKLMAKRGDEFLIRLSAVIFLVSPKIFLKLIKKKVQNDL